AQGIHGGDNETSLILHFRPDTVDMSKAKDFRWTHNQGDIPPVGAIAHGWIASDVHPEGVAGEAHLATAEKGARTAQAYVDHVIGVLRQIVAQDVSRFEPVKPPF
ncbi:MAG: creatininase family protein, partial [Pseudomonadota bacterium]